MKNLIFLSSAGADYAERDKQPRLREFIDLETLVMQPKGDPSTGDTGHSPCIIRAGFYAENLLLYTKQAQGEGKLPIPIGDKHKFAPVALGDVAQVAAYVVTSEGPHGLADTVRSQVLIVTGAYMRASIWLGTWGRLLNNILSGPQLTSGEELAVAASQALGTKMTFETIDECVPIAYSALSIVIFIHDLSLFRATAKKILNSEQGEEVDEGTQSLYRIIHKALIRLPPNSGERVPPRILLARTRGQDKLHCHGGDVRLLRASRAGADGVLLNVLGK